MDKKKLALTMAVATTLTVSSVSSSLPTVVYAQENTNAIENEENMVENGSEEATLPEETLPEEENLPATETEDVESSEEADSNVVEQNTEDTSVQEEKTNDESVSATADNNLSGNCGATENDNVTWELSPNDEMSETYTLTITGNGAMADYATNLFENPNHSPWSWNRKKISHVVVENGVTHIGNYAFASFSILQDVKLADSIRTIGDKAFHTSGKSSDYGFSVNFPKQLEKIQDSVFTNSNLNGEVVLPATLTEIGDYAFKNIGAVHSITVNSTVLKVGVQSFATNENLYAVDWTNVEELILPDISEMNANTLFQSCPNTIIYVRDNDIANQIINLLGKFYNSIHLGTIAVTNGGVFESGINHEKLTLSQPQKEDFVFEGWYKDSNFSTPATIVETHEIHYAKFVEKTVPAISFIDDFKLDKTYDGKAVSISENDYTLTDGAGDVTFSYQVKNEDTWADVKDVPTNAGTYRVKAVVAENDNYKGAETDWKEFTIGKATPAYTLPTDLTVGKGKTLATVTLPEGFTWADETQTADELGTHEFKAVYTPEDTANYEVVDVMITVEVVPNTSLVNHAPEIEVSDKTLTVGDVFDPMENVIVKDKEDSANDLVVDVTHNVDTNKAGVYEVTYTVTDTKGATTIKKIYVTVNPKMEILNEVPTIHAENITITVGDKFDPLKDVTATDKEDGTLTDKIEVLNDTVDINKAGVYEVTYKVTDSNGATVTKTITVTVKEKNVDTPTTPEKPNNTTKPDNTTKPNNTDTPQTGDMTNLGVFASMLAGSSGALAVLLGKRRKNNKND